MTSTAGRLDNLAATLYEEHVPLLVNIARGRFGIPQEDALAVVHDTFVSFLRVGHDVRYPEKWLVAAICNAARQYHREHPQRMQTDIEDTTLTATIDTVRSCIDAARLLAQLSPTCRHILTSHYLEGYSAREIASSRETSVRYAEREIHRCLESARGLLREGACT